MTTKPTTRTTRAPRALAPTVTDVAVTPVADATTPANDIDGRIDAALPGNTSPNMTFIRVMAHAFARVAPMPVKTRDERVAVRSAIVDALTAAYPGVTNSGVRNSGMFSGLHVFESQNTMFLAAALSGAYITDGHFVAAWSADLPNAKCPYLDRASYPTGTLSEYLGVRHNAVPGVDGAMELIRAWANAKRNRPTVTA